MNGPVITIVHNNDKSNFTCKLLLIYDENKYYYSESKTCRELRYFKEPHSIETHIDRIILHSKNNKQILEYLLINKYLQYRYLL